MSETKPLTVQLLFVPKTYDIDYANIVNNAVYIRWLEDLRLKILAEYFPLDEQIEKNISPVLERTDIRYRHPVKLFDEISGIMWVSDLGRARWKVRAEFWRHDVLVCMALQTGCFIDLGSFRPVRIPDALQSQWKAAQQAKG